MWQKENINEPAENSLQDEYIKIMKSAQKGKDSNIYLYLTLCQYRQPIYYTDFCDNQIFV